MTVTISDDDELHQLLKCDDWLHCISALIGLSPDYNACLSELLNTMSKW